MTTSPAILTLRGVSRQHGTGAVAVHALRSIDLDIAAGEFVALMGASGSGKSTLLHLIAGLDQPDQGSIQVAGVEMTKLSENQKTLCRRQRIGLIFQSFQLLDTLTAEENVALPLVIARVPPREVRDRAHTILDEVGLGARKHHRPHQLSGGEQQRVAIARALVIQPSILLADEPTGNLDSVQGSRILGLLRHLVDTRKQTLLLVTHDSNQARYADRVLHLMDGRFQDSDSAPGFPTALPCNPLLVAR
jgi:putative ABC transport system ATP-binding protein